ncbi:MAG: hypothetical protein EXS00_03690 [Phycisphaerales bacterium]|nr:hypothetical protein [Phycisphaerales bacterium]
MSSKQRPRIGITASLTRDGSRHEVAATYLHSVLEAGGIPLILPAIAAMRAQMLDAVDGVLLTGGPDIDTRPFNIPLHHAAQVMDSQRQEADFELLRALDSRPEIPVLGICLGMQEMGFHAGGTLIQHLADEIADSERHLDDRTHSVTSEFGSGEVASSHHQALADAGSLGVAGHSDDGIIEALCHRERPFYVGVQWHPERTKDETTGIGIVRQLIAACHARHTCASRCK